MKGVDWEKVHASIIGKKRAIKHILSEMCEARGSCVVIHDNPLRIEIHDSRILFLVDDEIAGILSKEGMEILDSKAEKEIEYWCIALSSLGFKRYSIKKSSQNISSLE